MILTNVKVGETITGQLGIKGTVDNPYLVVKNEFNEDILGSYPTLMNPLTYQSMDETTVLDKNYLIFLWDNMKMGHSQFKLDEGLYMNIHPRGYTRFNRLTNSLITDTFPFGNDVSEDDLNAINAWNLAHGFVPGSEAVIQDDVPFEEVFHDQSITPLVTYHTHVVTPIDPGGVDNNVISEQVLNLWDSIDNDRFMKILPTKVNFGNHIVLTQFKELAGSDNHTTSYYKEIKVRVKHNRDDIEMDNTNVWVTTHDLLINNYSDTNMLISLNAENTIQIIGTNVAQLDQDPVYVIKLIWDKSQIANAVITDLVMYDNTLTI